MLLLERADATAVAAAPRYRARLAGDAADLRAAQALRFEVFNLELDEGLVQSYDSGLDEDSFDEACDHLIVEDLGDGKVVGTYRMQTGQRARAMRGYYSEREFDFSPFEVRRAQILELGRACVHQRHRGFAVLKLLWRGIATYAAERGARHLVGCSSLDSQDPACGLAAYQRLALHLAPPEWRTRPVRGYECRHAGAPLPAAPPTPRLLGAYLALGAVICGPPAIDREFRTIDFLTMLDLRAPRAAALLPRVR